MYGYVDDSLLWFVRFCECAVSPKGLGLTQSKLNPCVFFKSMKKYKPKIIVIYYVDDCCIVGKPEHVEETKKKLLRYFEIVEDGQLGKLLGVRYK